MEPIEKDDHFIPDGMNAFERNVKRIGDCFSCPWCTYCFFSFIFDLLYCREK